LGKKPEEGRNRLGGETVRRRVRGKLEKGKGLRGWMVSGAPGGDGKGDLGNLGPAATRKEEKLPGPPRQKKRFEAKKPPRGGLKRLDGAFKKKRKGKLERRNPTWVGRKNSKGLRWPGGGGTVSPPKKCGKKRGESGKEPEITARAERGGGKEREPRGNLLRWPNC